MGTTYEKIRRLKLFLLVLILCSISFFHAMEPPQKKRRLDSDIFTYKNNGPLFTFAKSGHHSLVKEVIRLGANPRITNEKNCTALHIASLYGRVLALRTLLPHFKNSVDVEDISGETPLTYAIFGSEVVHNSDIERNPCAVAQLLIAHGANVNHKNKTGETPIFWAAFTNNTELARLLLEHGAVKTIRTSSGKYGGSTALSWAGHKDKELVALMEEYRNRIIAPRHAFLFALHPRLGENSPVRFLCPELIVKILEYT